MVKFYYTLNETKQGRSSLFGVAPIVDGAFMYNQSFVIQFYDISIFGNQLYCILFEFKGNNKSNFKFMKIMKKTYNKICCVLKL